MSLEESRAALYCLTYLTIKWKENYFERREDESSDAA